MGLWKFSSNHFLGITVLLKSRKDMQTTVGGLGMDVGFIGESFIGVS